MSHKHNCKHENVKYCDICNIVVCEDCGREWVDKCILQHQAIQYFPIQDSNYDRHWPIYPTVTSQVNTTGYKNGN